MCTDQFSGKISSHGTPVEMVGVRAVVLWMVLWNSLGEGKDDLNDFLICPDRGDEETPDCGPGGVIDILQAWVAKVKYPLPFVNYPCRDEYDWRRDLNTKIWCRKNLAFLSCHGRQSCVVNKSLAEVRLPNCRNFFFPLGLNSDVLYVRYRCHQLNSSTTVMLPSPDDVTSNRFDVLSPGFPEVTKNHYNVTCLITPSEYTNGKIRLHVITKVIYVDSTSQCIESLDMSLSGEHMMCYRGTHQEYRNDRIEAPSGDDNWTLKYKSDGTVKHKFWIQIKATQVDTNDVVEMVISCVDNLAPPTTTTTTTTTPLTTRAAMGQSQEYKTRDKQTDNLVIGLGAGAALLVVVAVIVTVVFVCRKRRNTKKSQPDQPLQPSAPLGEDVTGLYCIARPITEASNGAKPKLPLKAEHQASRSAKGKESGHIEYADILVLAPGAVYAQVNEKDKKNKTEKKTPEHSAEETIMVENSDLYEEKVALASDKIIKNDNGDLYESLSPSQPNSDVTHAYDNIGFSKGPIIEQ